MSIQDTIRDQVTNNDVVLYMKGSPQFPQCGFSSAAVQILKGCGVKEVLAVNVLADDEIRQGIKEYSNWPTIPQLYIKGEFVGGSDIMREMHQNGELLQIFSNEFTRAAPADPRIDFQRLFAITLFARLPAPNRFGDHSIGVRAFCFVDSQDLLLEQDFCRFYFSRERREAINCRSCAARSDKQA